MTDKEILDEVYFNLRDLDQAHINTIEGQTRLKDKIKRTLDFIEVEWQKADEEELNKKYPDNESWHIDAKEMERHRGLEIDTDGTVKEIK